MRKKWECIQVHTCSTAVSTDEYNLLLDEWAQTVYRHFSQLSSDQNLVPATQTSRATESAGA